MKIAVTAFQGAMPRPEPQLLPDQVASHALNCRLETGAVEPLKAASLVTTLAKGGNVKSVYRWGGQYWFHWATRVHAVKGPIAQDTEERTYFTGDGVPKMTYAGIATESGDGIYPSAAYDLGVPAPDTAPTLGNADNEPSDATEDRAYVYTWVSAKGEEGPPSPPAYGTAILGEGTYVNVTTPTTPPAGNRNITHKRIYRTLSGADSTAFQFVAEVTLATELYQDTLPGDALGEYLPSLDWYPPPADLAGLIALPIGSLAGFSKNQVCFTPPNLPHAWPFAYRYSVDYDVVALGRIESALVVLTNANPYLMQVADPSAVSPQLIEQLLPCVSAESAVSMGHAVIYAGPEGLVSISGAGARVITEPLFTPQQWAALNPASMRAFRHHDRYVCFYDTGSEQAGFIVDPNVREFTFITPHFDGGWTDPITGELFLIDGDELYEWEAGNALNFRWTSKVFRQEAPRNFGAYRVLAPEYPVRLKVWADGALKFDKDVTDSNAHVLPGGFTALDWQFELSATRKVTSLEVAESIMEIRGR